MKISELGEFGLIRRLTADLATNDERVVCGIGDDCSAIRRSSGLLDLVTTDLLVERVHFLRQTLTPKQLGHKAMSVNLSDIAAMGGRPENAYVSLAVPADLTVEYLDELYLGLRAAAEPHGVRLLGGDTTGSKADLVINVAVTGVVAESEVLYRRGARPGDRIFVSGPLGDSGAGLFALLDKEDRRDDNAVRLIDRHLQPIAQVKAGRAIAKSGLATAMIDVSDGLVQDLGHICEASKVGAAIEQASLPLSAELTTFCRDRKLDPLKFALGGGEDYVLLLTGDSQLADKLKVQKITLHPIGAITDGRQRLLKKTDGSLESLEEMGWDHFRSAK